MEYGIALYFDDASAQRLSEITRAVAEGGANRYMLDASIPPHLTLAMFETEDIAPIEAALRARSGTLAPGGIVWASLGMFVPAVLYAAPVVDDYLRTLHAGIHQLIEDRSAPGGGGHYLPNRWVPHTAFAVQLTAEELTPAAATAAKLFTAFAGRAEKLVLAECNPYREIAVYPLGVVY